jgi:hypothetical protein
LERFFTCAGEVVGDARSSSARRIWSIVNPACMASSISTSDDRESASAASSSESSSSNPNAEKRDHGPGSTRLIESRRRRDAPGTTVISTAQAILSRSKIFASCPSSVVPLPSAAGTVGAKVRRWIRRAFGGMCLPVTRPADPRSVRLCSQSPRP